MKGAKVSVLETLILKAGGDRQLDLAPKELGTWDPKKKIVQKPLYVPLMEYHTRGGESTKKKKKCSEQFPGKEAGMFTLLISSSELAMYKSKPTSSWLTIIAPIFCKRIRSGRRDFVTLALSAVLLSSAKAVRNRLFFRIVHAQGNLFHCDVCME